MLYFDQISTRAQGLIGAVLLWLFAISLSINVLCTLFFILLLSAYICYFLYDWPYFKVLAGLSFSRLSFSLIIISILLGLIPAFFYRQYLGNNILPNTFHYLAISFVLIGITEELITRGLLAGLLMSYGSVYGLLFATISHTVYKVLIFYDTSLFNIGMLAFFTFSIGLLFSLFRYLSGSVIPCMISHGLFDLIVYGDRSTSPPWIWAHQ